MLIAAVFALRLCDAMRCRHAFRRHAGYAAYVLLRHICFYDALLPCRFDCYALFTFS